MAGMGGVVNLTKIVQKIQEKPKEHVLDYAFLQDSGSNGLYIGFLWSLVFLHGKLVNLKVGLAFIWLYGTGVALPSHYYHFLTRNCGICVLSICIELLMNIPRGPIGISYQNPCWPHDPSTQIEPCAMGSMCNGLLWAFEANFWEMIVLWWQYGTRTTNCKRPLRDPLHLILRLHCVMAHRLVCLVCVSRCDIERATQTTRQ